MLPSPPGRCRFVVVAISGSLTTAWIVAYWKNMSIGRWKVFPMHSIAAETMPARLPSRMLR